MGSPDRKERRGDITLGSSLSSDYRARTVRLRVIERLGGTVIGGNTLSVSDNGPRLVGPPDHSKAPRLPTDTYQTFEVPLWRRSLPGKKPKG